MKGTVNILDGSTFVTSDERGDIAGTPVQPHGFFTFDTRFLSRWRLTVDGDSPAVLSTDDKQYFGAQFFLAPTTGTTYIDAPTSIVRRRMVDGGMYEEIRLMNHSPEQRTVQLRIDFDADFADLFEVKDQLNKKGQHYRRIEDDHVVLGYRREDYVRETWIRAGSPCEMREDALIFSVDLPPNGSWGTSLTVSPVAANIGVVPRTHEPSDEAQRLSSIETWMAEAPTVHSNWRPLERAYDRSLRDLAALRLRVPLPGNEDVLPAAGLPWFMSLFGRDSLITSYQALHVAPELARMTLTLLARLQGTRMDDFRDEEPGKMPHEFRFGEMTAFEERPHSPYYGTADATTLWLVLLDEYERWTGREDVVRRLEPQARAALDWIDAHGDLDGDGYIEYDRRNKETGLENQCWKDSWNSILYADGRMAPLPRATCELQGYAYDAKRRTARIARDIWGDPALADRLEREAAALKERFNRDFWLEDRGYYALALDGEKRQVDSLTSNIGHLLWSGIADEDKAASCVRHLMSDRMFSGWGVRTMAEGEGGYNPIGYHVGTVWPHDNSIVAAGLRRYGYATEAARIAHGILDAAAYFDYRLPEAFAGYPRSETNYPAEYPTACSPQAWATGTPLALLRTLLGLEVRGSLLSVEAVLPRAISHLEFQGIPGRWGRTDAAANEADTILGALNTAAEGAPHAVRELFDVIAQRVSAGALPARAKASIRFDLTDSGSWFIGVDEGGVTVKQSRDDADCVLEMRDETLLGLLAGDASARTALLSGKVKVHGDLSLAARFGQLVGGAGPDAGDGRER